MALTLMKGSEAIAEAAMPMRRALLLRIYPIHSADGDS